MNRRVTSPLIKMGRSSQFNPCSFGEFVLQSGIMHGPIDELNASSNDVKVVFTKEL